MKLDLEIENAGFFLFAFTTGGYLEKAKRPDAEKYRIIDHFPLIHN